MHEPQGKNIPQPTAETIRYWEGCRDHELLIQQCKDCKSYQFYPRLMCVNCSRSQVDWVKASGHGRIVCYTIVHRAISKAYVSEVPYVVALIQLKEGPTMMSNIINCDPNAIAIGMDVQVTFETWSEGVTMPQFSPIEKV